MNSIKNERFTIKSNFCGAAFLLSALILNGCFTGSRFSKTNTENKDGERYASNTDAPQNTNEAQKTSDEARALDAKYYEDSDGDAIPDFIEIELGKDPNNAEHCPMDTSKCGGAGEGSDFNAEVNTLLMLDASGSMKAATGGISKLDAAKTALMTYAVRAPKPIKMGFLVYGHKGNNTPAGKAASCAADGAELLNEIGGVSKDTFQSSLDRFEPTGWTPIAAALRRAGEAFAGREGKNNHIVMVSDGLETCGGDPVAVAKELHEAGIRLTIDVVGFGAGRADVEQLKQIAAAGGGDYFDAKTQADLNDYLFKQMEASSKATRSGNCFAEAVNDADLCDGNFVNQAVSIVNEAMQANHDDYFKTNQDYKLYPAYSGRDAAYQDLKTRIDAALKERQGKRQEVWRKAEELWEKSQQINRQTGENYDKNK